MQNFETPLHFASKFGHVDMVKLLANEPLTKSRLRNKYNQTAADVACARSGTNEQKALIEEALLGENKGSLSIYLVYNPRGPE